MNKQHLFFLIFCSGLSFNAWAILWVTGECFENWPTQVDQELWRRLREKDPHRLGPIEINQLTYQDREDAKEFVSTDRDLCYYEKYLENRVRIAKAALCGEYSKEFMEAAMCYQDFPLVQILLEEGANPNATYTVFLEEPLFKAKSGALAQLLVKHGALTSVRNVGVGTLLHQAMHEKYPPDLVQYYIDKAKIDVNSRASYEGATPLHAWATFSLGLPPCEENLPSAQAKLERLLKAGADSSLKDTKGRTPLDILQESQRRHVASDVAVACNTLIKDLSKAMGIVEKKSPIVIPNEDQECSICLNTLKGAWCQLDCAHVFHTGCVDQWLTVKEICPLCRNKQIDERLVKNDIIKSLVNILKALFSWRYC